MTSWLTQRPVFQAHFDTTTTRPEEGLSLSSLKGGEGRGEEADLMKCPSPPSSVAVLSALRSRATAEDGPRRTDRPSAHSFLAGRGREFLVVGSRCAPVFPIALAVLIVGALAGRADSMPSMPMPVYESDTANYRWLNKAVLESR